MREKVAALCVIILLCLFESLVVPTSVIAQSADPCVRANGLIDTSCYGRISSSSRLGGSTSHQAPEGSPEEQLQALDDALRAGPKTPASSGSYTFYDLSVANLCGPGSINELADNFIRDAYSIFGISEKRAVALTLTPLSRTLRSRRSL
jgi:hypothetical protein